MPIDSKAVYKTEHHSQNDHDLEA